VLRNALLPVATMLGMDIGVAWIDPRIRLA
jgi:ABC-type dipeptide/oligopeptide/nickel transport system permease component